MLATRELAIAYWGGPPPFTLQGSVAMLDGKPVGIGGIHFVGDLAWAFSEMKPELRARRRDLARCFRVLERQINAFPRALYAVASEPTSGRLLERLGFAPTGHSILEGPVTGPVMVRL